jgi:deoxyribonuclease V
MKIPPLHSWNLTPKEAIALQKELAGQIDIRRPLKKCELLAGADCSYNRFSPTFYAAVVVLRTSDWSIVETQGVVGESPFPYVPGLLSFREAPIVLQAFAKLKTRPDAVMCDGQGYAHPRRLGLACHLGLWLKLPCFGCAKTRLIGVHDDPGPDAGNFALLKDDDEIIGHVVRTKTKTKPVYVSPGHLIDQKSATRWTLTSCRGYRIPEPTRQAHLFVNQMRLADAEKSLR